MKFAMHTHKRPKRSVVRIPRNRGKAKRAIRAMRFTVLAVFRKARVDLVEQITKQRKEPVVHKSQADNERVKQILDTLDLSGFDVVAEDTQEIIEALTADGAVRALLQIGADDAKLTEVVNDRAVWWAKQHSAELVGKKWVDDTLVDSDSEYSITNEVMNGLQRLVTQAEEEGWSNDHLSTEIEDMYALSDKRADLIARTETAFADTNGNMIAYQQSGLVSGKEWILGSEHGPDEQDECNDNEDQGVIPLDQPFASGDMVPPAHPNCVCDFLPVLAEEQENEDGQA